MHKYAKTDQTRGAVCFTQRTFLPKQQKHIMSRPTLSRFLSAVLFLMSSCDTRGDKDHPNVKLDINDFEVVDIPITTHELNWYTASHVQVDTGLFWGYNHTRHACDIFDIDLKRHVKSIKLDHDGPQKIAPVGELVAYEEGVILQTMAHLIFLSKGDSISRKLSYVKILGTDTSKYSPRHQRVTIGSSERVSYYTKETSVIIPLFPTDIEPSASEKYYKSLRLARVNVQSGATTFYNVPYPEELTAGEYFGSLDYPQLSTKGDSLIYNFPYTSEIFCYNTSTAVLTTYTVASRNIPENYPVDISTFKDPMKRLEHRHASAQYAYVLYDPHRNLFYRSHKGETEFGKFSDFSSRYLTIMDENFNPLVEAKLPEIISPMFAIAPQGLIFQYKAGALDNEEFLRLAVLNVDTLLRDYSLEID
ncbi:MAG: DUF4221 family protein [Catalinimonas sp.]